MAPSPYEVSCWWDVKHKKSRSFYILTSPCMDPENIFRGGPTLTMFFLVDEGREDPNTTIRGPSLASQRNAI